MKRWHSKLADEHSAASASAEDPRLETAMKETQILASTLNPLGPLAPELVKKMSAGELSALNGALMSFLEDAAGHEGAGITRASHELSDEPWVAHSILTPNADKKRNVIVSFSFKDAAIEAAFPILGLALTLYGGHGTPATIAQVGGALKTLWSKLIVLKRPQDADAIDTVGAIVRARALYVIVATDEHPTTADLENSSGIPAASLVSALKLLKTRGVIEAASWAAQEDDMNHPGNRWRIRL